MLARLAKPFGLRILAVRQTPMEGDDTQSEVDFTHGPNALEALLEQSDYLVLSVPYTSDTAGMIGASELARLPRGAVLINIARGGVIDEPALIESLRTRHLDGAALDVVAPGPLSPNSPLWSMPNALITPHSMSTALSENKRLTELFCDNLRRYLDGQPLRNVIDKRLGY